MQGKAKQSKCLTQPVIPHWPAPKQGYWSEPVFVVYFGPVVISVPW